MPLEYGAARSAARPASAAVPDRVICGQAAQLAALRDLLVSLSAIWGIPPQQITVHKEHAQTDCPGRNFMTALPSLLKQVAAQRVKTGN